MKNKELELSLGEGVKEVINILDKKNNNIFKKKGLKFDENKLQWSLLPFESLEEIVKVLMYGLKKYSKDNWKYIENAGERYLNAAFRHLIKYSTKNKIDKESGFSHLSHCMCCLLFLQWLDLQEKK